MIILSVETILTSMFSFFYYVHVLRGNRINQLFGFDGTSGSLITRNF